MRASKNLTQPTEYGDRVAYTLTSTYEPRYTVKAQSSWDFRLGLGLGINGIAAGAGLVLGPVVGGVLAPYGWQWIFLYNVPIGIFGTVWAYHRLKEPANLPKSRGMDWAGVTTFILAGR